MIQQQRKVCLSAMKLIQWPAIARGVSGVLWPGRFKAQISTQPFSCSSTLAQAHEKENSENLSKKKVPETQTKEEKLETQSRQKGGNPSITLRNVKQQDMIAGKELEAVVKVQSMSSAIEICSTFNTQQSIDALKNLVAVKARPLPLIQALAEGIAKSSEKMNMKEISDVLYLFAKLSYINEDVLSKTCEAMKLQLKDNKNAAVVGSSITSIKTLQWKDPDLLDEFSLWIQNNIERFENPSGFIYTLALQNHVPPNIEDLMTHVWKDIARQKHPPSVLITLVWSLYALQSPCSMNIAKETLQRFFNKTFLSQLRTGPADIPVWIQLWNLHAVAKSVWGTTDFTVPEEVKTSISNTLTKNAKKSLVSEVTKLLFKDLDANLYATNVPSQMGFPIDLVMSLDDKMNVIPLNLATSESTRIAIMVHSYRECCQPTKEPNGAKSFAMRLLGDQYRVISVPYHVLGSGYVKMHEYFDAALKEAVQKK